MARFNAFQQYLDANGDPLGGGKLYFYETGTTTEATTYSDSAMTTANANPVILDADGRQPDVFFDGNLKCVLTDSDDVTILTRDPVGCCAQSGSSFLRPGVREEAGTSYTITATDEAVIIYFTNASAVSVTIPDDSTEDLPEGFLVHLIQWGAGAVTVAGESTAVINSARSLVTDTQYSGLSVVKLNDDLWHLQGDQQ